MTGIKMSDLVRISPLLATILLIFILIVYSLANRNRSVKAGMWLGAIVMGLIAVGTLIFGNQLSGSTPLWGGLIRMDMAGVAFTALIATGTAAALLFAASEPLLAEHSEYPILLVSSAVGLMLMVTAFNLITLYIGMEMAAIPLMVLAGFLVREKNSTEAGLKYFLYGAMASAVMLYGLSLLYGLTGEVGYAEIRAALAVGKIPALVLVVSLLLIVVGFGYKIAAVPFHFWAPDVYEGAPAEVSGFLATVSKSAGFVILLRFMVIIFPVFGGALQWVIAGLAVLSMLVGNLLAMQQKNIKRLLAYSSIAHAGYLLVGVAAATPAASAAVFYYLTGYLFTNLAAFALAAAAAKHTGSEEISSFSGLSRRSPALALMFLIIFLSLAGIPPFAGFAGKFLVFYSAAQAGLNWLVVVAVLNSVLALFYYLNVIKVIYARPKPEMQTAETIAPNGGLKIGLAVCITAVLYFGVFFMPWYGVLTRASLMLWG